VADGPSSNVGRTGNSSSSLPKLPPVLLYPLSRAVIGDLAVPRSGFFGSFDAGTSLSPPRSWVGEERGRVS
jgi:hypothetical protein